MLPHEETQSESCSSLYVTQNQLGKKTLLPGLPHHLFDLGIDIYEKRSASPWMRFWRKMWEGWASSFTIFLALALISRREEVEVPG
jgi:hypothetical protein